MPNGAHLDGLWEQRERAGVIRARLPLSKHMTLPDYSARAIFCRQMAAKATDEDQRQEGGMLGVMWESVKSHPSTPPYHPALSQAAWSSIGRR